jgi:uncharacterized protein YjbJ (UPF0337 family)
MPVFFESQTTAPIRHHTRRGIHFMNSDQVKGKANQVVGKVKQGAGELTGNDRLANKGVVDQAKGAVQETWGNVKDAVHETGKTHEAERQHKANETRDNISHKVENAKNNANEKIDNLKDQQRDRRSA